MSEVTRILSAIDQGDPHAAGKLLPLVYDELRKLAAAKLALEKPGQTLQATALVHEAYVRLVDVDREQRFSGRGHFFAAAAEAMRRILVEHARARQRVKRGGGPATTPRRPPNGVLDLADESADPDEILMLDEAIRRLEQEDPEAARVVRLRFFAGLSVDETAEALGVSPSSVDREWAYARARLHRLLAP